MEAIRLFDTHAHLLDGRFDEDREALISGLPARGVACVLEAACEAADIPRVIALCERHPGLVYGAAGIHPHSASEFTGETLAQIESALAHPAIRAVGEIGLDYHYDFSPREAQKACFDAQLALAGRRGRPVVIHDREAHGDCLDLPRFLAVCQAHDAFSMIDVAHSTGGLGATGRGLAERFGCGHPDITLGTLSKALGAEGGFVCGSHTLVEYLRNTSRSFIFSTAPGAPAMAAAEAALAVLEQEPERVGRLRDNVAFFVAELAKRGLAVKTDSAIVPIPVGDERRALAASAALQERGFLIPAIRYPTVAKGQARLRAAVMSAHTKEQLASAAEAIAANHPDGVCPRGLRCDIITPL